MSLPMNSSYLNLAYPEVNTEERHLKKRKVEFELWNSFLFSCRNVSQIIISYLSFEDLRAFELASKVHQQFTDQAWKGFREREYFNFDWMSCAEEKNIHKWNYYLSKTLISYEDEKHDFFIDWDKSEAGSECCDFVDDINQKFEGMQNRFPFLKAYIQDTLIVTNCIEDVQKTLQFIENQKKQLKEITKIDSKNWRGEDLLELLFQFQEISSNKSEFNSIIPYMEKAIDKKAFGVSLFAFKWLERTYPKDEEKLEKFVDFALKAFKANPKDQALISLLTGAIDLPTDKVIEKLHGQEPDVWAYAAQIEVDSEDFKSADHFYTATIEAYHDDKVPARVWEKAAFTRFRLGKLNESASFYAKAIEAYGENKVPEHVWANMAAVKINCKKFDEAEFFCAKAINVCGNQVSPVLWTNMAYIKFNLNKLEEAEHLSLKAIEAYGDQVPTEVWENAAQIKLSLNKVDEAKFYLNQSKTTRL